MDGEILLPRNKLFDRIDITLRAYNERIASYNEKKQTNLAKEISKKLQKPI